MSRTRFAIYAAVGIAFCAAATQASALRNQYTDASPPGVLPWVFGTPAYDEPDWANGRPIPPRYRHRGSYGHAEPVPPPPFLDDID